MKLDFEENCISCMRWDIQQVSIQEQTQEVKLSDGMPDIGSILGAWGQCILRGKEWRAGNVGLTGGVMVWVLYQPVGYGNVQTVEVWIPFQEEWELGDSQREGNIRSQCLLKVLDARMISERRIMIRAGLEIMVEALEVQDLCIHKPPELPEDVQLLQKSYPVMLPREAGEKYFVLDEDLLLPDLQRLLYCRVDPQITQQQVVGDKLTFIGVARCHLLYDVGDGNLQTHDTEIEFSQLADLDREYDKEAVASVIMELSSIEPEMQDGRIRLKCGLIGQYLVCDMKTLELTEDAYSPVRNVSVKEQELQIPALLDINRQVLQSDVQLNIPCTKVVDAALFSEHPTLRRSGDMTELVVKGSVQVLYHDLSGNLQCSSGRWSGQWELPSEDTVRNQGIILSSGIYHMSCSEGQLKVIPQLQVQAMSISGKGMNAVTGMDLGDPITPEANRPSMILRRKGDLSLWDLAKETGSTMNDIRKANGFEGEPSDNRLLLIPIL